MLGEPMKNLIKVILIVLFTSVLLMAQEKSLDKTPEPVGGISALAKNIVYPEAAKLAGVEGKVFVKATIDKEGKVTKCEIKKSVSKECDEAAINAIQLTKFNPGVMDGKKVVAEVTIPISFKLKDKS